MTRAEFLAAARALVGAERGTLTRVGRLCGFSMSTLNAISQGIRSVPPAYAKRISEELSASEDRGSCVAFVGPRLGPVVEAAIRAGWSESDALAAVAGWAGLRLFRRS